MSYYADDIRRIAKQQNNKSGIGSANPRLPIFGSVIPMSGIVDSGTWLTSPAKYTALTYDPAVAVEIEDTSAVLHTIQTVATGKVVGANGNEILIDEVIFTPPP